MHIRKKRLEEWILERGLPINKCGKIVVPTRLELDSQLDVLQEQVDKMVL